MGLDGHKMDQDRVSLFSQKQIRLKFLPGLGPGATYHGGIGWVHSVEQV